MVKKMEEQSVGAVEGVSIPPLPPRKLESGRRPPVSETGTMLYRLWKSSGREATELARTGGCTQAAFSAYCHHVQVAPVSVLSALQKLAGWSDEEVLRAHERDVEARDRWARRGKKIGGRKAALSRASAAGESTGAPGAPIGVVLPVGTVADYKERATVFVRGVFGLPRLSELDGRDGRVFLLALRDAVEKLLAERP